MADWQRMVNGDPLSWLVELDPSNPGIRWFALCDLLDRPAGDPQVIEAHQAVMLSGPVPAILAAQSPDGYWVSPGPGYYPKYRSTVWQVMFLAQLGADGTDPRVQAACEYVLDHTRSAYGGFSADGRPSGLIQCLQGSLAAALLDLGCWGDKRLDQALDWLSRSITGEGIAPARDQHAAVRYYRSGNSGPGFACSANNHEACAWGAVKAMLALSKVPAASHTSAVQAAIRSGMDFLLGTDPARADYPHPFSPKPSGSWFKFGHPIGYVTDLLQNLEALTALGCGGDRRLAAAVELLRGKQDGQGRWKMEYTYNGKTWADVEEKGRPSKWITVRALRVLKRVAEGRQGGTRG